jgi:hypothetical protein
MTAFITNPKATLKFSLSEEGLSVDVPVHAPDSIATVIPLETRD